MAQNPAAVAELCKALEAAKGGKPKTGKKGFSCKKTSYLVAGSDNITVDSWRFQDWDYKRDDLPTYARGLFTTTTKRNTPEICIRGYDKFFNVGEVRETEWPNVEQNTTGPYELSVKENGCIIFISGLEDGTILVCSKHSTGSRAEVERSHAQVGEKWVQRHVTSVGRTTHDLARRLHMMNATAVGELCDDEFEEHVLEYPPDMAGLYLHGINFNLPEFSTMSGPEVHEFADLWGFKKAQYLIIQTIDEVKSFLDKCAQTGSWDGRDTEGFVVRCKLREKYGQQYRDWFFKYKFEEPYLMYRQWREATKSVIAGKPPRFKKHKAITEEYLLYARRQLAKNSNLAKEYNANHGIIAMRDGFLAEKGLRGSDIILKEQTAEDGEIDDDAVTNNVVLVPIATIGCGKTTIATALVKLFDFGHVQNDNIEGPKNRPHRFALGVTNAMGGHSVVIADRNNHQFRERQQIINDVSKVIPSTRFVALHYVHEPKERLLNDIRKVTRKRVLDRGDNHQTIRASSKGEDETVGIMEGFLHRFQGCNTQHEPDCDFDQVINLDVTASSLENLETVITHLYNAYPKLLPEDMPTQQDMIEAIEFAMKDTVTTKHELAFNSAKADKRRVEKKEKQANLTIDQLVANVDYFSIAISHTVITSTLSTLFSQSSPEEAEFYHYLKQMRRLQSEFHVTLIHRASSTELPQMWENYIEQYRQALANRSGQDAELQTPSLGPARVRLERLVWDGRVMAIVVRLVPLESRPVWECANAVPHITLGTGSKDIKPRESNDLLETWISSEGPERGANVKLWEKEVPGMKILEGTVRASMQRGR